MRALLSTSRLSTACSSPLAFRDWSFCSSSAIWPCRLCSRLTAISYSLRSPCIARLTSAASFRRSDWILPVRLTIFGCFGV